MNNIIRFFIILGYTIKTIYPFLLTLLCIIFYLIGWQICLILPLFLAFNLSDTLLAIIKVLFEEILTLGLLGLYMIIIIYFFSWIGFFYIPKLFKYEPVNKNNEFFEHEENICSSAISCILYFLNFGITSEGAIDMNLISFKDSTSYYLGQFFFDLILYACIHMIFFNVFLATITDSFGKMRDEIREKDNDIKNVCFICQKTKNDCINDGENFEKHCQDHNKWKYIMFICNLLQKDEKELSQEKYIIYKKIKEEKIDWFPKYKKPTGLKKIKQILEKLEKKINKIEKINNK